MSYSHACCFCAERAISPVKLSLELTQNYPSAFVSTSPYKVLSSTLRLAGVILRKFSLDPISSFHLVDS